MARATGLNPRRREPPPRPTRRKATRRKSTTGYVAGSPKGGKKGTIREVGTPPPVTDTPKRARRRRERRVEGREQRAEREQREEKRGQTRKRKRRRARRRAQKKVDRLEREALETFREGVGKARERRETPTRRPPQPKASAPRSKRESASRDEQLKRAVDRQVIEPAKRAKVLPKEKTTGQKIAETVAETGIALTPGVGVAGRIGTTALRAGKAAKTATKAVKASPRVSSRAKGAAKKAVGKERSRQQRNLAAHRRRQAALRASRRNRPKARHRARRRGRRKATKLRERYLTREGHRVGRRTRSMRVGLLTPYATATGGGVGGLGAVGVAIQGHAEETASNPTTVGKRTIEIAPGLVVSTLDLVAQTAKALGPKSMGGGNYEGLRKRVSEDVEFAKELAAVMASGDLERVRRYVRENGLIAPIVAAPLTTGLVRAGKRAGRVREAREKASRPPTRRDPLERQRARQEAAEQAAERARAEAEGPALKRAARRAKRAGTIKRTAGRERGISSLEVKRAGKPIIDAYRGRLGRRGMGGRRKVRNKPVDRGDVLPLAAEEGLLPGPQVAANFEAVARKWADRPVFAENKREGGVTGHELVEYVRSDPGVWSDKAFWEGVEAYRRQEPDVVTSDAIRDVEQAKTHGVQLFEDRPPPAAAAEIARAQDGTPQSRADVENYIGKQGVGGRRVRDLRNTIVAAEGRARELRAELRQLEKQERGRVRRSVRPTKSQVRELAAARALERRGLIDKQPPPLRPVEGRAPEPPPMLAVTQRRREQLLDVEADIRGMRAELAGTKQRHKTIKNALRDPDQLAAVKREFDAELAAVRQDKGLARGAYVPHTDVGREGIPVAQPIVYGTKKIQRRSRGEDSLAERGRQDYSLEAVVEAGTQAPRIRKRLANTVSISANELAIPVPVKRPDGGVEHRRLVTSEEGERGLTPAQKRESVWFPLGQWNQAVKQADGETMVDLLSREVEWRDAEPGRKGVVMDRGDFAELKAQTSAPTEGLRKAQAVSRGLARTILYSAAWAAAQIVAEGWQAAHALTSPVHLVKGARGLHQMDPKKRVEFEGTVGVVPGMGATPREWWAASGRTHQGLADGFKRLNRILPLRMLVQAVRGDWLNWIDRGKAGKIRAYTAAARAHKAAYGFGARLERLVAKQHDLSERLAKMSSGERLEWGMRSTKSKREIESSTNDVLGEWRALSRREKPLAVATIFYPFVRMSFQWTFYSFPKRHPIRASIGYGLAASHNAQLREVLGSQPDWLSEFGTALLYDENGKGTTISARRIIPGANAMMEAIEAGGGVATQRGLNPVVAYFNAMVNGIDPLSGEQVTEGHMSGEEKALARVGLASSVLVNTAPPVRFFDLLRGPKEPTAFPIVGDRREPNALGETLEALGGSPLERALRAVLIPSEAHSFEEARDIRTLREVLKTWREAGSDAQDATINDDSLERKQKKARLRELRKRSDWADRESQRLYRKYAAPGWKAQEERESDEYYELRYEEAEEDKGTGNAYLDAFEESEGGGNAYLEALPERKKGNAYLDAIEGG